MCLHTSQYETSLSSGAELYALLLRSRPRCMVDEVCMCNGVTNIMGAWDDAGHSTTAAAHGGGPHFTLCDISLVWCRIVRLCDRNAAEGRVILEKGSVKNLEVVYQALI